MKKMFNLLSIVENCRNSINITFLVAVIFFFVAETFAQWQPDFRLTYNPAVSDLSRNNARCIAKSGDTIHVVWGDYRTAPARRIYYKRSLNNGSTWEQDVELTSHPAGSGFPSIAAVGSSVHVTYSDIRNGHLDIYYKYSSDNGLSWSPDIRLTTDPGDSRTSSLAVSGDILHVAFLDNRGGNQKIFYKRSLDAGISWSDEIMISNSAVFLYDWINGPSISASSENVIIVWQDDHDGNLEIYSRCSSDYGDTWEAETRLTNNSSSSQNASVIMLNSSVNVVWQDNRDGNFEIYYMKSTDNGFTWSTETRLTDNNAASTYPSVAVSGETIHVFWQDYRDGNGEIYYKQSNDSGISWEADLRLTNDTHLSQYVFTAASDSVVHIVWQDNRDGNEEVYYKRKLIGSSVGIEDDDTNPPSEYELKQNYPNPFNPTTKIKFTIPSRTEYYSVPQIVTLKVYDVLGNEVATLVNEEKAAGSYEVEFNAARLSSGIYFYKLQAENFVETKKMLLVK